MKGEILITQEMEQTSVREVVYLFIKRVFDIICSLIGIIFLVPITIAVKIISMLSGDFESIFFVQDRIGKNGEIFRFYKFRSMIPNADEVLFKLLKENKKLAANKCFKR